MVYGWLLCQICTSKHADMGIWVKKCVATFSTGAMWGGRPESGPQARPKGGDQAATTTAHHIAPNFFTPSKAEEPEEE